MGIKRKLKTLIKKCLKGFVISLPFVIGLLFSIHFDMITHGYKNIDPTFQPIYSNFISESKIRGFNNLDKLNISIQFADIDQTKNAGENKQTLGECSVIIGKNPEILIDRTMWKQMSYNQQEMTVFHELGHCFLLKGHTNTDEHEVAHSLMNSLIFDEQQYVQNRSHYLDELFSYRPYHIRDYAMTFFIIPAIKIANRKLSEQK